MEEKWENGGGKEREGERRRREGNLGREVEGRG